MCVCGKGDASVKSLKHCFVTNVLFKQRVECAILRSGMAADWLGLLEDVDG